MTTATTGNRFTVLPDDSTLVGTALALEEHGFGVEIVDDLEAARAAVLARIPDGSSVMTNTSVTLEETGIADTINGSGQYESHRNRMLALDFETQLQEMKAIAGQPDYALGSVHAITRDGILVIASASGSQLASYVWGAAKVIFVVGAQKLVPDLATARERIYQHSLKLEDVRAFETYGQNSHVGKLLEIHDDQPGRIHIVLVRRGGRLLMRVSRLTLSTLVAVTAAAGVRRAHRRLSPSSPRHQAQRCRRRTRSSDRGNRSDSYRQASPADAAPRPTRP